MPNLPSDFKSKIDIGGLWAAMRWLNSRVPYRYSAVFAFDGDNLRNLCLVDKEDENVASCGDQPITQSYCTYVHQSGEKFDLSESRIDARVEGHPKRRVFQSYYGVPLVGAGGKILGTVCHFDTIPRSVTANVAEALDEVAPIIREAAFGDKPEPTPDDL